MLVKNTAAALFFIIRLSKFEHRTFSSNSIVSWFFETGHNRKPKYRHRNWEKRIGVYCCVLDWVRIFVSSNNA